MFLCVGLQWRKKETGPGIFGCMCKFPVEKKGNWTRTFCLYVQVSSGGERKLDQDFCPKILQVLKKIVNEMEHCLERQEMEWKRQDGKQREAGWSRGRGMLGKGGRQSDCEGDVGQLGGVAVWGRGDRQQKKQEEERWSDKDKTGQAR